MMINNLINEYGKKYSPYSGNLVNHLPMAQMALYKMTNDLDRVKVFTEVYTNRANINLVKKEYEKIEKIEDCLGNRDLYESCLDLVEKEIEEKGMEKVVVETLNKYPLGISSGLFHTIIRLAYSVEGAEMEEELIDEVTRAVAYYITAYREAGLFVRKISKENSVDEMKNLIKDSHIQEILRSKNTRGQKIKGLYEDESFMEKGFIIEGYTKEKIKGLLNILLPIFINTESIVALHCITGLHATLVLKEYYKDFPKVLDVLTTSILIHLLTIEEMDEDDLYMEKIDESVVDMSWDEIFEKVSKSSDAHVLKLAYTASELYRNYKNPLLKVAALQRL